jgi:hypothetical protein
MEIKIKCIPGKYRELKGDVTSPHGAGLILQVVNDVGAYGAGVSGSIGKRWSKVPTEYRRLAQSGSKEFTLGHVQFIYIDPDFEVANLIAQKGLKAAGNPQPLQYDVFVECLKKVAHYAKDNKHKRIHVPYQIGCGLAGGDWEVVEKMLIDGIVNEGLELVTYRL